MMRGLLAAIAFLTRLPVPPRTWAGTSGPPVQLPWYPVVGLLIGAILSGLAWLLSREPPLLAAALLLLVWVGITGGLHLDGLADSTDAWVGGLGDRARTLDIMKDPRSGPMGVTAIGVVLLLKFAALAARPEPVAALWLAPLLGRGALTLAFMSTPYVRSGGMGSGLAGAPRGACLAVLLLTALLSLGFGFHGVRALVAAAATFSFWRWSVMHRLGGMTGDTCGALTELVEMAVLVALVL
ncbi:adenosylcobinamide-GDP ribazoletransferase [Rhodanobacter sp. Si-c]|uniref:Adenosylcobinamide-GDP ribazoletransferase n=1 Tax=Rhodanobacter lycopersici TaxID=3162487 RepID=A0ABV3QEQ3_9GAMM